MKEWNTNTAKMDASMIMSPALLPTAAVARPVGRLVAVLHPFSHLLEMMSLAANSESKESYFLPPWQQ